MKTLKDRLQAIKGGARAVSPGADIADLGRRIERLRTGRRETDERDRVADVTELAKHLGAVESDPGLLVMDRHISRSERHGRLPMGTLEEPLLNLPSVIEIIGSNWLFLDTETTGLAGGSGTLVFMVGVARYREGCLRLRQYLITRFAAEESMLRALGRDLDGSETLVSYNGKSFDLPLLTTRFRIHGVENSLTAQPHLDLLHPVRRRFAKVWENCRLATVEKCLLGFERKDDLPGSEAPEAWLDYVRTKHWRRLQGAVQHNRWDLLSLAVLLPALDRAYGASTMPQRCNEPIFDVARDRSGLRALRAALQR
jgi:uncharacterized protein YprB with RNaseH-like and TPR domain